MSIKYLLYNNPEYKKLNIQSLIKIWNNYYINFDHQFYINFYNDLKIIKYKNFYEAHRHWNLYGKYEGRICNENMVKFNYFKAYLNENKEHFFNKKKEEKINILIRTCYRPEYFYHCINSILKQNYKNYEIYISYDNLDCLKYLERYKSLENVHIYNLCNYITEKYKYNDYLNFLMNQVNDGYILFLDDDDKFYHNNVLKIINENITDENNLLIYKFLRPDKVIFPENIDDIQIGEIGTSNFCFHSKHKKLSFWEKIQCADYYFITKLINSKKLNVKFIDFIISMTIFRNKTGNFGL